MKIPNIRSASEVVKLIASGDRVIIQGGSATPRSLIRVIVGRTSVLKGVSKIAPSLKPILGIVVTRTQARFVATKYGVVTLFSKTLKQRAIALRDVAHLDHREELDKAVFERFKSGFVFN